jgi:hypothetical protein
MIKSDEQKTKKLMGGRVWNGFWWSTDSGSEGSDFDHGPDKRTDTRLLKGYIFGIEEFFLLEEKLGSWGLKFNLLNGELLVRTVPGLLHETTAVYFTYRTHTMFHHSWKERRDKIHLNWGGGSTDALLSSSLTVIEYVHRSGPRVHTKQPDSSFIPTDIQIPPAKPEPGTIWAGDVGVAFPTVVFQVVHRHESWALLLRDAWRKKAFSRGTWVQLVVGVKLFKHEFKVFWAKRARGGRGMKVMRITESMIVWHEGFCFSRRDLSSGDVRMLLHTLELTTNSPWSNTVDILLQEMLSERE